MYSSLPNPKRHLLPKTSPYPLLPTPKKIINRPCMLCLRKNNYNTQTHTHTYVQKYITSEPYCYPIVMNVFLCVFYLRILCTPAFPHSTTTHSRSKVRIKVEFNNIIDHLVFVSFTNLEIRLVL